MKALALGWTEESDGEPSIEQKASIESAPQRTGKEKATKEWMIHVERQVVEDASVSRGARLTYTIICGYVGKNCKMPFPSLSTLAKKVDCERETLQGYIAELKEAGYLEIIRRRENGKFKSNGYRLLRPSAGIHRSGKNRLRKTPLLRKPIYKEGIVNHTPVVNPIRPIREVFTTREVDEMYYEPSDGPRELDLAAPAFMQ
jgi:Helix-turn-helix domain